MGVHIIWDPRPRARDYCVEYFLKMARRYVPRPRRRALVCIGLNDIIIPKYDMYCLFGMKKFFS